MIPPCLTLSNIRYVSRVMWSNPGKEVASSLIPRCSRYWKGSLLVTLDYGRQQLLYVNIWFNMFTGSKIKRISTILPLLAHVVTSICSMLKAPLFYRMLLVYTFSHVTFRLFTKSDFVRLEKWTYQLYYMTHHTRVNINIILN